MARKPRRKKVPEIRKIWDVPLEEIQAVVEHLKKNFPTSGHLVHLEKELKRREEGKPIPEVSDE